MFLVLVFPTLQHICHVFTADKSEMAEVISYNSFSNSFFFVFKAKKRDISKPQPRNHLFTGPMAELEI